MQVPEMWLRSFGLPEAVDLARSFPSGSWHSTFLCLNLGLPLGLSCKLLSVNPQAARAARRRVDRAASTAAGVPYLSSALCPSSSARLAVPCLSLCVTNETTQREVRYRGSVEGFDSNGCDKNTHLSLPFLKPVTVCWSLHKEFRWRAHLLRICHHSHLGVVCVLRFESPE